MKNATLIEVRTQGTSIRDLNRPKNSQIKAGKKEKFKENLHETAKHTKNGTYS